MRKLQCSYELKEVLGSHQDDGKVAPSRVSRTFLHSRSEMARNLLHQQFRKVLKATLAARILFEKDNGKIDRSQMAQRDCDGDQEVEIPQLQTVVKAQPKIRQKRRCPRGIQAPQSAISTLLIPDVLPWISSMAAA